MSLLLVLIAAAIGLIKFGQGLENDLSHLVTRRNRWLVIRGVITAVILVPILYLFLILIFQPTIAITLAIIIMGVAPAADLSSNQVETLGGDKRLADGILFVASLISIITVPLFLKLFEMILKLHVEVNWLHVIQQVAVSQFIPMSVSFPLKTVFPQLIKSAKYIIRWASLLLIICFVFIIIKNYKAFGEFTINGYLALIVATISAFILGILVAGKNAKAQIAFSIESAMRNPGLAFLLVRENFPKERADLAMVPYLVTTASTIILCILLLRLSQKYWKSG